MKKKCLSVLLAAVTALSFTACGANKNNATTAAPAADAAATADASAGAASASKIDISGAKLLSDGVLSVGCEVGYPPFEDFADDGTTPIGFDIDIISAVGEKLGLDVNIINTAWDGIFAGIGVNYDVTCSAGTITPEREETMLFSTPYINNFQAVVLLAGDNRAVNSFNDLDGLTIALQKETTSDILMSDYKSTGTIDVQIVANEKITSCFKWTRSLWTARLQTASSTAPMISRSHMQTLRKPNSSASRWQRTTPASRKRSIRRCWSLTKKVISKRLMTTGSAALRSKGE